MSNIKLRYFTSYLIAASSMVCFVVMQIKCEGCFVMPDGVALSRGNHYQYRKHMSLLLPHCDA